jgi:hypothetical protein
MPQHYGQRRRSAVTIGLELHVPNPVLSSTGDSLETLVVERGRCHFSAYRNITISVWVGQANVAAAQAALGAGKEMARRHPHGHSAVCFVLDGLSGPTPDAQPLIAKVLGQRADLKCAAIILEGSGFWASGLRSMINNIHREGGGNAGLKIATTLAEVVAWLSENHQARTGVAIAPDALAEALSRARQLGAAAAAG